MSDSDFIEDVGVKPMSMSDLVCKIKDSKYGSFYVRKLIKKINKGITRHLGSECEADIFDVDYDDDVPFTTGQLVNFVNRLYHDFDIEVSGYEKYSRSATIKISPARV